MRRVVFVALLIVAQSACESRTEVEAVLGPEPESDTFPALLPIGQIPAPSRAPIEETTEANAALQARAESLRRRAASVSP